MTGWLAVADWLAGWVLHGKPSHVQQVPMSSSCISTRSKLTPACLPAASAACSPARCLMPQRTQHYRLMLPR